MDKLYLNWLAGTVAILFVILGAVYSTPPPTLSSQPSLFSTSTWNVKSESALETTKGHTENSIFTGVVEHTPYLYCANVPKLVSPSSTTGADVILLHGTAFTKETWYTSGLLAQLCHHDAVRSVTALDFDLNEDATGEHLGRILTALSYRPMTLKLSSSVTVPLISIPVTTLVTPSAGAAPVLDWISNSHHHQSSGMNAMQQYTRSWIPIASNGVMNITASEWTTWKESLPAHAPSVLALYGAQDAPGKESMTFLHQQTGAQVVELPGGHACYLDSPDAFVRVVTRFIQGLL
jgi:hypothetical protein